MHDFLEYQPPEDRPPENHPQLMIGKVASLYDITVQTLRHYDKIGLFRPEVINPETGYRYYSVLQLRKLEYILFLRQLELTLPEIQEAMERLQAGATLTEVLRQRDGELEREIQRLQGFRDVIAGLRDLGKTQSQPLNTVSIVKASPPRRYLFREIPPLPVASPDFALRLLEQRKALLGSIPSIQTSYSFGATVSLGDFSRDGVLRYTGILLDPGLYGVAPPIGIQELPEGYYAVIRFHRDHTHPEDAYGQLRDFIAHHRFRCDDTILEIGVDASFSSISRISELAELQIHIHLDCAFP